MVEKTKVYEGSQQPDQPGTAPERVRLFEQKIGGRSIWLWLLPLLLVLGIAAWLLSRNRNPPVATAQSLGYVNFDTDKATLTPESQATLDRAADAMKQKTDMRLRVQGFTDNTGDSAHNVALSNQRSDAVTQYLSSKGIDRSRLDPEGFGDSNPVASNATSDGKATNRRVELFAQ